MTIYSFGDILLVPFPFSDQTRIKRRPAVVISSSFYNQNQLDLIVMAITSQTAKLYRGDTLIVDWKQAKLLHQSAVKPVLSTLDKALVICKLGELSDRDKINLQKTLKEIIEFDKQKS